MIQRIVLIVIPIAVMTGCKTTRSETPRPALIGHIVFVELNEQSDYDTILADSDRMLSTIPSVSTYAAGRHIDTGRSTIINDYDLAIYLGFESIEDLNAYVAHDQHIGYVKKWKPMLKSLRVYDMHDPTP